MNLSQIKPHEICSIRPPTENFSLTFRLTRNCYWNKCWYCPVYKFGTKFSKRSLVDIKEDIANVKKLYDLLLTNGLFNIYDSTMINIKVQELINKINKAKENDNICDQVHVEKLSENIDPKLKWFLTWFKEKPTLADSISHILTWKAYGDNNCFIGDSDSLILKPDFFRQVMDEIKKHFPDIERFTVYGRTSTAARNRTIKDLEAFRDGGLNRVHFGLESGCDKVLRFIHKGITSIEHIEGGVKTRESGLSCSVYVMPGLGGANWSEMHSYDTADVLTKISPDYIRLRTLQIFPQTMLEDALKNVSFIEASEEQIVKEIKVLIENINTETEIISDSATNLLNVNGKLPDDKEKMLNTINDYLKLSPFEKLKFSLESRINSFIGQYGGLTPDIMDELSPFVYHNRLNVFENHRDQIINIIRKIRAKLMP